MRELAHTNGDLVARSLFDYIPDDLNEYEKSVALFLDAHPQVLWWYRNLVGPENFAVQGYRRHPLYPDFVVQEGQDKIPIAQVLVLETKGGISKATKTRITSGPWPTTSKKRAARCHGKSWARSSKITNSAFKCSMRGIMQIKTGAVALTRMLAEAKT